MPAPGLPHTYWIYKIVRQLEVQHLTQAIGDLQYLAKDRCGAGAQLALRL